MVQSVSLEEQHQNHPRQRGTSQPLEYQQQNSSTAFVLSSQQCQLVISTAAPMASASSAKQYDIGSFSFAKYTLQQNTPYSKIHPTANHSEAGSRVQAIPLNQSVLSSTCAITAVAPNVTLRVLLYSGMSKPSSSGYLTLMLQLAMAGLL